MGLRVPIVLLGLSLVFAPPPGKGFSRQDVMDEMKAQRPEDLQVLIQRPVAGGQLTLGIYSIEPVAIDPQSRRYRLWEESPTDLNIYSNRCIPAPFPRKTFARPQVLQVGCGIRSHLEPG